jgi:hypothetical protein
MSEWKLVLPEGDVVTTFTRPHVISTEQIENEDGSITFRQLLGFKDGAHMKEFYDVLHCEETE